MNCPHCRKPLAELEAHFLPSWYFNTGIWLCRAPFMPPPHELFKKADVIEALKITRDKPDHQHATLLVPLIEKLLPRIDEASGQSNDAKFLAYFLIHSLPALMRHYDPLPMYLNARPTSR